MKTKIGIYLDEEQVKMLDDIIKELNDRKTISTAGPRDSTNDSTKQSTRASVCYAFVKKQLKELHLKLSTKVETR